MTVFADSSALVKLYADEVDAERVRSRSAFVVSALARVEVPAALWRKHRQEEVSADDAGVLVAEFVADWHEAQSRFLPVPVRTRVLEKAAELSARHGLRAYDAVQLSCAVLARGADASVATFLCFDVDLMTAAARESFELAS